MRMRELHTVHHISIMVLFPSPLGPHLTSVVKVTLKHTLVDMYGMTKMKPKANQTEQKVSGGEEGYMSICFDRIFG